MERTFAVLMLLALSGCTSATEYGACIGIDGIHKPGLVYKVSTWNVFIGLIFIETLIVPLSVITDAISCPVGKTEV